MNGAGYETCARCDCLRRRSGLEALTLVGDAQTTVAYVCRDAEFCEAVSIDKAARTASSVAAREDANPRAGQGPKTKLTPGEVVGIKGLLASGVSVQDVAREYRMSPGAIHKIQSGDSWNLPLVGVRAEPPNPDRPPPATPLRIKSDLSGRQLEAIRFELRAGTTSAQGLAHQHGVSVRAINAIRKEMQP